MHCVLVSVLSFCLPDLVSEATSLTNHDSGWAGWPEGAGSYGSHMLFFLKGSSAPPWLCQFSIHLFALFILGIRQPLSKQHFSGSREALKQSTRQGYQIMLKNHACPTQRKSSQLIRADSVAHSLFSTLFDFAERPGPRLQDGSYTALV